MNTSKRVHAVCQKLHGNEVGEKTSWHWKKLHILSFTAISQKRVWPTRLQPPHANAPRRTQNASWSLNYRRALVAAVHAHARTYTHTHTRIYIAYIYIASVHWVEDNKTKERISTLTEEVAANFILTLSVKIEKKTAGTHLDGEFFLSFLIIIVMCCGSILGYLRE